MNTPNRRLELRFRPDDIYCKPTCADRHKTNGFLLRVRIKKSRIKKLEEDEAKQTKKQSINNSMIDDNKSTENNVDKMNLSETQNAFQCNNKDQQDQVMTKLIDQVQNCSFNILDDAVPGPSHENLYCENIKELEDLSLDTNDINLSKCKKNISPTFDRNKYEDLSEDKDYELPKLQILGRVETEFKFTSKYYIIYYITVLHLRMNLIY